MNKTDLELVCYYPSTKTEQKFDLGKELLEKCESNTDCQILAKSGNKYLTISLPFFDTPSLFVFLYRVLKILGSIWLTLTPILGGILLLFPIIGYPPPVNQKAFWVILFFNLYWLYFFLKRSRPLVPVGFDVSKNTDVIRAFSQEAISIIQLARISNPAPTHVDLLRQTLSNPRVKLILFRLGLDSAYFEKNLSRSSKPQPKQFLLPSFSTCIYLAYQEAAHLNERYVQPEDLFLAALKLPGEGAELLKKKEISFETAERCSAWVVETLNRNSVQSFLSGFLSPVGGLNRDWTGTVTPELDRNGIDFTKLSQKGLLPQIVGRTEERKQLSEILSESSKNNALLIGPAGSGKTSIVQGLAVDIAFGQVKGNLKYKRLVSLDVGALIGGTKTAGEMQDKIQRIVKDLQYGNVILFLDDIEAVSSTKVGDSDTSLLSLLERSLSYGKLQVVASTTQSGYKKYLEGQANIARLFRIIEVKEPTPEETAQILSSYVPIWERKHKTYVTYPAIEEAVSASNHYIHNKVLPDKALEVLEQAVINASKSQNKLVMREDVDKAVTEFTKIPLSSSPGESDKLLHLEDQLHKRVIGQEEAISAVSNAMRRLRAGLKSPNRPIAAFLFLGPTGVGKTELAKTLCNEYFGSEKRMVRLDMSEFETEESINNLIGAPVGGKGHEAGGQLTESVKNQPFSLVLLDEIEKASPKVMNALLSVLDEGRLSDSSGFVVDFTNTIIIATSNAGSDLIRAEVEKNTPINQIQQDVLREIAKFFKPEFLNRFDGIVVYKPLTEIELTKITILWLDELANHLKEKQINFTYGTALVTQLSKLGFDPKFGARPLRRVIQEKVENYLAKQILEGKIKPGDTVNIPNLPS